MQSAIISRSFTLCDKEDENKIFKSGYVPVFFFIITGGACVDILSAGGYAK